MQLQPRILVFRCTWQCYTTSWNLRNRMDLSELESSSHSYSLSIDKLQMSTLKVHLHNCHMLKVVNISSWTEPYTPNPVRTMKFNCVHRYIMGWVKLQYKSPLHERRSCLGGEKNLSIRSGFDQQAILWSTFWWRQIGNKQLSNTKLALLGWSQKHWKVGGCWLITVFQWGRMGSESHLSSQS